jgi:putative ABC transport system substrate-binding protein
MFALRRREFLALVGSAAAAWPAVTSAQQGEKLWRIGVLVGYAEDDPEIKARLGGFRQGLERLGLSEGHNVRIDIRFAPGGAQAQMRAKELVALRPDVIVTQGTTSTTALQRQNGTAPIVFVGVSEPIDAGFVASLSRPGGNFTGLMLMEASITGKWVAMLKEIAPRVERAAFMINPTTSTLAKRMPEIQAMASSLGVELVPTPVKNAAEVERIIESIAREPNGGLVVTPTAMTSVHRDLIIELAARHRLPAVYPRRVFVTAGGLMSYGTDDVELFRQAATYVDHILKGAKPTDLPVQAPTKYETVLNLKTAKALGLTVPPGLLVAADEVIE